MITRRRHPVSFLTGALSLLFIATCSRDESTTGKGRFAEGAGETAAVNTATADEGHPAGEDLLEAVPGIASSDFRRELSSVMEKVDAAVDEGWDTEVFHEEAKHRLERIGELLARAPSDASEIAQLAAPSFACNEIRPTSLAEAFRDSMIAVYRPGGSISPAMLKETGPPALADALRRLRAVFTPSGEVHAKFKIFRVEPAPDSVRTDAYLMLDGPLDSGEAQVNTTWSCFWERSPAHPRLLQILATEYEEIRSTPAGGLRFNDVAPAVFRDDPAFQNQFSRGIDYWRDRIQGDFGIDVNGLQGIALGDVDGDGLEDIYISQQGGLPNRLYLRRPDGSLRDVSREAGVDWIELTRAALFVDLDNDGDQDLALAQGWYWMLMENDGSGRFTKRHEQPAGGQLHSLTAADYDGDGDLDLYFCGRNPRREQDQPEGILGTPIPYHDANNGGPNLLLRNDGDWRFTDATAITGLDVNNRRYSYAAAWEDFDNDGDLDLYVANDFGRNNLYRNDLEIDGVFRDIAAEAGVEDISAGMSVAWGDYDRDGAFDLYVGNMFSSAGNRIAYQRRFRGGGSASLDAFRRHARGNSLFRSLGNGQFEDVSVEATVTMGRWAWGSLFADLNNDGWEDLYVANGFITTEDTGDL
ncbi:MAG TPA: VCBS repeat-containing protein [Verrucomicrobiales bacterium]|nr:VCBS repeat-containing protein [Verrucomicrobiales bacterium]